MVMVEWPPWFYIRLAGKVDTCSCKLTVAFTRYLFNSVEPPSPQVIRVRHFGVNAMQVLDCTIIHIYCGHVQETSNLRTPQWRGSRLPGEYCHDYPSSLTCELTLALFDINSEVNYSKRSRTTCTFLSRLLL